MNVGKIDNKNKKIFCVVKIKVKRQRTKWRHICKIFDI